MREGCVVWLDCEAHLRSAFFKRACWAPRVQHGGITQALCAVCRLGLCTQPSRLTRPFALIGCRREVERQERLARAAAYQEAAWVRGEEGSSEDDEEGEVSEPCGGWEGGPREVWGAVVVSSAAFLQAVPT